MKKKISDNISVKRMIHYRADLKAFNPQRHESPGKTSELRLEYYDHVPDNLFKETGAENHHIIDGDTTALVAFYKDEPVGTYLFNTRGKAVISENSWFPFGCTIHFGDNDVYAHTLFVKEPCRRMGIGESLKIEAQKIFKDNFDSINTLTYFSNISSNRISQKLGMEIQEHILFCKFFGRKFILRLNNRLKLAAYTTFSQLLRFMLNIRRSLLDMIASPKKG